MTASANDAVLGKHLDSLAVASKQYTLTELLHLTQAVAADLASVSGSIQTYEDFTGATSSTGGVSGFVPAPQAGDDEKFLRGDGTWALPTDTTYTAGYGLSLADNEFSVTLQGGGSGGLSAGVAEQVNNFFTPKIEFKDRYAEAPFEAENIFGLDLSHLVDGENFELDTENLTDGKVTRIRSGSASYNVNNGISRGYVEVKTLCRCTLTVTYSISSQSSYDYGGCIITTNAPNTTFTYANLKAANFFYNAGNYSNQTATYTLAKNTTYYLNFGYAKNASTNTNDDRFYIHSIRIVPDARGAETPAEYFFDVASDFDDCIVGGVGGKFVPSVATMTEFVEVGGSNYRMLENKMAKIFAGSNRNVPQYTAAPMLGGEVVASLRYEGLNSSLVGSNSQYVTLVADTSSVTRNYTICPLTDSGGFIYRRDLTVSNSYDAGVSIQPFVITSTGKPSLGTAASILGAQSSASYPSQRCDMIKSIYDPTHIMFLCRQDISSGKEFQYTTIAFQGNTNTYTRVKALTTLGTEYSSTAGKTSISFSYARTAFMPPVLKEAKISISSLGAENNATSFYPYTLTTYNSSGGVTATTYKALVHHGLYRAAPTELSSTTDDFSGCFQGIWRSKSNKWASCYMLTLKFPAGVTLSYSDTWWDNLFDIYVFDLTSKRIIKTSWTLSKIIDDMIL